MPVAPRPLRRLAAPAPSRPLVVLLLALSATTAAAGPRRPPVPLGVTEAPPLAVDATLQLRVEDLARARRSLDALLARHRGTTAERTENARGATLVYRLPPDAVEVFVAEASALGAVQQRSTHVADVTASLSQLDARRRRLEVWARRAGPSDAVQPPSDCDGCDRSLPQQLIDAEEEHRVLKDRVERGTVNVELVLPYEPSEETPPEPRSAFSPGVRVVHLVDARGDGAVGMLGVGFSVRFAFDSHYQRGRDDAFTLEADLYRALGALRGREGADAALLSLGFDLHSDVFGGGRRRFLNPRLGLRAGVSTSLGRTDFALGASAGLELLRLRALVVEAQVRAWCLVGNRAGPHLGVQSGLTVAFAY